MKANEVSQRLLDLFKTPEDLQDTIATVFIKSQDTPCFEWSWRNQMLTALARTSDARGYRQWKEVGRQVKKGSKAFHILVPCISKDKETGEVESTFFKTAPVFRIEDTDGEELPGAEDRKRILNSLPLTEVATSWGLEFVFFNGGNRQGFFSAGRKEIGLGVENPETFFHELIHAADSKLGNLKEKGQHWRSETVAEFGAAVLAKCLDVEVEINLKKTFDYIQSYSKEAGKSVNSVCMECLERICESVDLVLKTAEEIKES